MIFAIQTCHFSTLPQMAIGYFFMHTKSNQKDVNNTRVRVVLSETIVVHINIQGPSKSELSAFSKAR